MTVVGDTPVAVDASNTLGELSPPASIDWSLRRVLGSLGWRLTQVAASSGGRHLLDTKQQIKPAFVALVVFLSLLLSFPFVSQAFLFFIKKKTQ